VPEETEGQGQQGNGETPPATGSPQTPSPPASPSGETPSEEGKPKVVPVAELATERRKRKEAEARLAKLEQAEQQRAQAEMSDAERAAAEAKQAQERADQLHQELRRERLAAAVRRAAKAERFVDEDDAVNGIDPAAIEWDDDGKPAQPSVDRAVKTLAKAKPHWLHQEGDHTTGSKFGGSAKTSGQLTDSKLREYFPALGPGRRTQT
jgi:flagellar biosynthesis GTPase FlhF